MIKFVTQLVTRIVSANNFGRQMGDKTLINTKNLSPTEIGERFVIVYKRRIYVV